MNLIRCNRDTANYVQSVETRDDIHHNMIMDHHLWLMIHVILELRLVHNTKEFILITPDGIHLKHNLEKKSDINNI